MPRSVDHGNGESSERNLLAVVESSVGREGWFGGKAEEAGLFRERVVEGAVGGVDADGGSGRAVNRGRPADVVEVAVGVEERDRPAPRFGERPQYLLRFVSRIDHEGLTRLRVRQDRAVALQRPDRDRADEGFRQEAQGFTATTVSTSCFSRRSAEAQTFSGEERFN